MDNVQNLKNEKRRLDYELMEERYRFESLPKRKAFTKSKIIITLLFAIPITALVIACVIKGIEDRSMLRGVVLFITALGTILGTVIAFVLWRNFFKEAGFFFGWNNKYETNGARNYREEEQISTDRIRRLLDAIEEIDRKISESITKETVVNDTSEMDFFAYAYGNWGDGKIELISRMKTDAFEKEEDGLNKKIEIENQNLARVERAKTAINNNFQKVKDMFTLYFIGVMVCIFINLLNIDDNRDVFGTQIAFAIYGVVGLIVIMLINKNNIMNYLVENKYSRYKAYAEEKGIITTAMQKKIFIRNIEDLEHRLDYVQKVLEYKHNHNELMQ